MKLKKRAKLAFSLIELSVVILIIGILILGITQGSRIIYDARIKSSISLTNSSPVASIPNLTLWLESTNIDNLKSSTLSNVSSTNYGNVKDGDKISAWRDINPHQANKNIFTITSDGTRPDFEKEGIGNLPSISFTKSSFTRLFSNNAPIGAGDDSYTLIAVFRPTNLSATTSVYSYIVCQSPLTVSNGKSAAILLKDDDKLFGLGGQNNDYLPQSINENRNYIGIIRVDNSQTNNVTSYLNGQESIGASNNRSALDVGSETIWIGARSGSGHPFDGLISEVIIYDRALKKEEITAINSYLSDKYSIN